MAKKKVFVSYRRDDAAGFAQVLHDRLREYLPGNRMFVDVHGIETGADFVRKLEAELDQCGVLVVLIGKRWAGDHKTGFSRLQDPRDWVRVEVQTALRRGIKVIPVLLDGAELPDENALPAELRPLVRLQACEVRTSRINADLWDLIGSVMTSLSETWPPAAPGGPIYAVVSGLYAFLAGAALLMLLLAAAFDTASATGALSVALFVLNALIILRMPLHPSISRLTRQKALRLGAALHLVAFWITAQGAELDGIVVFLFGFMPAALLFLGAFAMQRRALSAPPATHPARASINP